MDRHTVCALTLSFLALPALAQSAAPASAPAAPAVAPPGQAAPDAAVTAPAAAAEEAPPVTVVVEGRRPGPGVWKVTKGDHVLYVFGTYSPLPQKMEWDSSRIERLVAHSQEVLMPPSANAHVGFFRGLTLLPNLIGIKKNPDGATLHDVLPADVYARWSTLKAKYIGEDGGIERERPMFASEALMRAGWKKNGLVGGGIVLGKIEEIAKKNKVKLSRSGYEMDLEDPRKLIKDFKAAQVDDVACFTKTLDSLDADIDTMRARANAWANGNIAEIRKVNYREREDACDNAILNSAVIKNNADFRQTPERLREAWLKTAEKSLADNASTFAILQIRDIIDPKGYLADLQAKGYTVESPK
ncbi:TraB/GumN family protein [Massilia sp. 9096]|uniref:TraB/GumN family protein n=1 Tax=Massilia sp. 9096 TaxID=1500894 RepID=UPI00055EAD86|nr:TraB/GumN family protein [Massilia sp. 9096]